MTNDEVRLTKGRSGARLPVVLLLVVPAVLRADMVLADGRLSLDGCVRASTHWWQIDVAGLGSSQFSFEPVQAGLGATGRLNDVVSARVSAWMSTDGGMSVSDMFVRFEWPSGWSVTAGQFLVPLSYDALTLPEDYPLMFNGALHTGYIKPAGFRDDGVLGQYKHGMWDAAVSVVNGLGSGSWSGGNVDRKDVCARLLVQPWCSGPWLGGRIYRAIERSGNAWLTWGGEASYPLGALSLLGEFQNHISGGGTTHNNSGYVQALYRVGTLEPGLRAEAVFPYGQRLEVNITAGAIWRPFPERVKLAAHYSYHRGFEGRWLVGSFLLRIQAEL
jgi:hypothetical protein